MRLLLLFTFLGAAHAADWVTFGGTPQRTGWLKPVAPVVNDDDDNDSELGTPLTKTNIHSLPLLWKLKLDDHAVMAPLIVERIITDRGMKEVAIVAGAADNLFAVDADLGRLFWKTHFETPTPPAPSERCPAGLTAMPTIVRAGRGFPRYTIYALASDGRMHSLSLANGTELGEPAKFLPRHVNAGNLNASDGVVYTTTTDNCNGVPSGVWGFDPGTRKVSYFESQVTGGPGGVAIGSAVYSVGAGKLFALSPQGLKERASSPDAQMARTTPAVFTYQGREIVAVAQHDHILLFDGASASLLHGTPSSAAAEFPGSLATYEDSKGVRWIYLAGKAGVIAFKIAGKLQVTEAWRSREVSATIAPVIVNGMVFVASTDAVRAFDASNGKELYSSVGTAASGLTVANGRLYLATTDGTLYCFGFPMER